MSSCKRVIGYLTQRLLLLNLLLPSSAMALVLGEIELLSYLNDRLDAEIELLTPQQTNLESLKVHLLKHDGEQPYKHSYQTALDNLNFDIVNSTNNTHIKVTSTHSVREPFLVFTVELTGPNVRLQREYTLLLDPPPVLKTSSIELTTNSELHEQSTNVSSAAEEQALDVPVYGPVQNGESLSLIAQQIRTDKKISIYRLTQALFQRNPEAFINGNINLLRKGVKLVIPDLKEIRGQPNEPEIIQERPSKPTAVAVSADAPALQSTAKQPALQAQLPIEPVKSKPKVKQSEDEVPDGLLRLLPAEKDKAPGVTHNEKDLDSLESELTELNQQYVEVFTENQQLKARVARMEKMMQSLRQQIEGATSDKSVDINNQATLARSEKSEKVINIATESLTTTPQANPEESVTLYSPWLLWIGFGLVTVISLLWYWVSRTGVRVKHDSLLMSEVVTEPRLDVVSGIPETAKVENRTSFSRTDIKKINRYLNEIDVHIIFGRYTAAQRILDEALSIAPSAIELVSRGFKLALLQEDVERFVVWVKQSGEEMAIQAPAIWQSIQQKGLAWIPDHPVWDLPERNSRNDEGRESNEEASEFLHSIHVDRNPQIDESTVDKELEQILIELDAIEITNNNVKDKLGVK